MSEVVRILFPEGMIGKGIPSQLVQRGIGMGADLIAIDGGSTDSGPYYLGTASAKTARVAVASDLEILLVGANKAGISVVVGSCGTSGCDAGVDWMYEMACEIAERNKMRLNVTRIYCEQDAQRLVTYLEDGKINALGPAQPLQADVLQRCSHIVGVMGHEPIAEALAKGANLVLAGRTTDTALTAALPLSRGLPYGPVWHAAKIAEGGGQCTTAPRRGGVVVTIDADGFTIEPVDPDSACTPTTVAAQMMYENVDPFRLREPPGTLDASQARYLALDDRRVRVEGSRFEIQPYTIKLEGAAPAGFQTMTITGMRDPLVLSRLDEWCNKVMSILHDRIAATLGLQPEEYDLQIRRYGHDAVLNRAEPERDVVPKEVGIVFIATAADQTTATQLAKLAGPVLLHASIADRAATPCYAFFGSPAETERGQMYEFVLQHSVSVSEPTELFHSKHSVIG